MKLMIYERYMNIEHDMSSFHHNKYIFHLTIMPIHPQHANLFTSFFYDFSIFSVQCSTRRISYIEAIKLIIFQTENPFHLTGFKMSALLLSAALLLKPTAKHP